MSALLRMPVSEVIDVETHELNGSRCDPNGISVVGRPSGFCPGMSGYVPVATYRRTIYRQHGLG
jgi:hypothetical protein